MCVCVCVCVYILIYARLEAQNRPVRQLDRVRRHIYISMYPYLYLYLSIHLSIYLHMFKHKYMHTWKRNTALCDSSTACAATPAACTAPAWPIVCVVTARSAPMSGCPDGSNDSTT